jgi:hypothetical protein
MKNVWNTCQMKNGNRGSFAGNVVTPITVKGRNRSQEDVHAANLKSLQPLIQFFINVKFRWQKHLKLPFLFVAILTYQPPNCQTK